MAYTAVTIVCAIVLYLVVGSVTASVVGLFGLGSGPAIAASDSSGVLTIPGVGTIDGGKIDAATKQMQAAADGQVKPIDGTKLQTLFPANLGGYTRTALETNAMGQMGTEADATYTQGEKTIHLKIIDSSGLGALAGIGSAVGAQHSREDADGYERATTVDGQMQIEKWNNKNHNGEFTRRSAGAS